MIFHHGCKGSASHPNSLFFLGKFQTINGTDFGLGKDKLTRDLVSPVPVVAGPTEFLPKKVKAAKDIPVVRRNKPTKN